MIQVFNQFSFVVAVIGVGLGLILAVSRIPRLNRWPRIEIVALYIIVMILMRSAFIYPDSPVAVESVGDVENVLINEKPTFVMLYSNY